jgi:hypothetical protein
MNAKIEFVLENVNDLAISDRKVILQMVLDSNYGKNLKENGAGSQININHMSNDLINAIFLFIKLKIDEQRQILIRLEL